MNDFTNKLSVTGYIYQLYPKNVIQDKTINDSLVGLPIRDRNGDQIGMITSMDLEDGTWRGFIRADMDAFYNPIFDRVRSMSVEATSNEQNQ